MGLCGNFTLLVLKLLLDWHVAVITHQTKFPFPLSERMKHTGSMERLCSEMMNLWTN